MSNLGFVDVILDNTNRFYQLSFSQFAWYKKMQGTTCIITRYKQSAKITNVFGCVASSTLPDDQESEKFNYTILISLNDMKELYKIGADPITFYDNEQVIDYGDVLTFSRGKQEYKWKVTDIQTFGETDSVLRQYTISGMAEIDSLK
jgi:hypothetical protein